MNDVWTPDSGGQSAAGAVSVKVNGEDAGSVASSSTLGAAVKDIATSRGLRTFTVYGNGTKLDDGKAPQTLAALSITSLELVSKDARG